MSLRPAVALSVGELCWSEMRQASADAARQRAGILNLIKALSYRLPCFLRAAVRSIVANYLGVTIICVMGVLRVNFFAQRSSLLR